MAVPSRPGGITAAGKGAVYWVPAIADPEAPTVAEVTAGTAIQCVIYEFNLNADQSTVESSRYCDSEVSETLGRTKWTIDPLIYDYDPQHPDLTTGEYAHYAKLTPGLTGYLVDRRGIDHATDPAAGQYVTVIPVKLGARNPLPIVVSNEGETLRVQQTIAVRGDVSQDVTIAA